MTQIAGGNKQEDVIMNRQGNKKGCNTPCNVILFRSDI
jgi:hypothetical protein